MNFGQILTCLTIEVNRVVAIFVENLLYDLKKVRTFVQVK